MDILYRVQTSIPFCEDCHTAHVVFLEDAVVMVFHCLRFDSPRPYPLCFCHRSTDEFAGWSILMQAHTQAPILKGPYSSVTMYFFFCS